MTNGKTVAKPPHEQDSDTTIVHQWRLDRTARAEVIFEGGWPTIADLEHVFEGFREGGVPDDRAVRIGKADASTCKRHGLDSYGGSFYYARVTWDVDEHGQPIPSGEVDRG